MARGAVAVHSVALGLLAAVGHLAQSCLLYFSAPLFICWCKFALNLICYDFIEIT